MLVTLSFEQRCDVNRLAVLIAVSALALAGACGSDDPLLDGRVVPAPAPTTDETGVAETSTEADVTDIRDKMEANPNVPEPIESFECPETFAKTEGSVMECVATLESGLVVDVEITYVNNLGEYTFTFAARN